MAVVMGQPPSKMGKATDGIDDDDLEQQGNDLQEAPHGQLLQDATKEIRLGFVRKVYGLLSVQLLLTVLIAAPLHMVPPEWMKTNAWLLWLSLGMTMVMMCVMVCCESFARNYPTNYLCLFGLTIFESILVGFISAAYTWQSVLLCAGLTAAIFLGLSIFACTTKVDFTGMGPYLFGGLLALIVFGCSVGILAACGVPMKFAIMFYDLVGILIFVLYIIYDTQMIIGGDHKMQFTIDDYAFAALNLYLDIIQLFLHLLRFLGEKNS